MKHDTRLQIKAARAASPLPVTIVTQPVGSTNFEAKRKTIDFESKSDQKWFRNHLRWAMHNQQTVSLFPR